MPLPPLRQWTARLARSTTRIRFVGSLTTIERFLRLGGEALTQLNNASMARPRR
jgi:hypothetical protein